MLYAFLLASLFHPTLEAQSVATAFCQGPIFSDSNSNDQGHATIVIKHHTLAVSATTSVTLHGQHAQYSLGGNSGWVDPKGRLRNASVSGADAVSSLSLIDFGYSPADDQNSAILRWTVHGTTYLGNLVCKELTQTP